MKIQMVDLKSQYEKIKSEVDNGIQEVINNTQFIKGPQIKQFEDALALELGVKHVIACANGTDALQIAMMGLGLKPGDEIILPVFTYVATAEVIALLGLTPVMVDVDPDTFCIDVNLIESKITCKTKAIVPVHLFGQCADMDAIMEIANKHNLFVIEDTAQAIGAVYRSEKRDTRDEKRVSRSQESESSHSASSGTIQILDYNSQEPEARSQWQSAGSIGNIGTTSFFPSKNLGCYGDGGALMTNDDELAKKIRMICNHGQSVQYVHDVIGVNSRLDSIQAAILNAKLPHLKSYELARNEAANLYDKLLGNIPNIVIPKRNTNSTHVFHQYTLKIVNLDRDSLRKKLADAGIPSMVYYPIELHKQNAFSSFHQDGDFYPVSEMLCQSVLSLPIHTEMTHEMVEYICKHLIDSIN
ncbi:MAG: DegT/DnrJ/EryC1/StrS family aminotransferase [Bacteroidia bacterium]|nr:DegT/DnrJ/EryC1/StrS family aminotransferase [Bacteroidia bacterium]MCF8427124.1 DegT/DnrJ/EryC1/StrS family aminotransferase [Bacteroidia bacterium]